MTAAILLIGGIYAAFYGLRWLSTIAWPPIRVAAPTETRRAARAARIDDFRNRRDA